MLLTFLLLGFLAPLTHSANFDVASVNPKFTLNSEDGSISYPCFSKPRPGGGPDWIVKCDDQEFAVHLLVKKYPNRNQSTSYQVLYWVLDYNDRHDPSLAGNYHGTNLHFNVSNNETHRTYHLGQVVQAVWSLDLTLNL